MQTRSALLLAALAFLDPTAAAPTPTSNNPIASWLRFAQAGTTPSMPHALPPTGTNQPLPEPSNDVKIIALGVGIQNYTCASTTSTPTAVGAVAKLYDATTSISRTSAWSSLFHINVPDLTSCTANRLDSGLGLPEIGKHYFDAKGVPNFDMSSVGYYLYAKKVGVVPPPSTACSGRDNGAPVDWLYLPNDGSGRSKVVNEVYRIQTAGGKAPDCQGTEPGKVFSRDYAAEYWFYE